MKLIEKVNNPYSDEYHYNNPSANISKWKNNDYSSGYYRVTVGDDTEYIFSKRLENIAIQIDEAKEILNYIDSEDVSAVNTATFIKTCNFLHKYSVFIERNYSSIIKAPYFDSLNDGSTYLNWDLPKSKLTIIFKPDNHPLAYFYGEQTDRNNIIPYKSAIEIEGTVDEIFAQWMKTYLA